MSEFTKGPWKISSISEDGDDVVSHAPRYLIAKCGESPSIGKYEAHANARLIAAAPEMFELLRAVVKVDGKYQPLGWLADARALIAKIQPFGPHTHAGVWISRETADKIARDGA